MNTVLILLPVAFLAVSVYLAVRAVKKGQKRQRAVAAQLLSFLAVCILTFSAPMIASAAEVGDPAPATTTSESAPVDNSKGMGLLAAALVTGLAGIGGGIAVAAGAPAGIAAPSPGPKAGGEWLVFVALGGGIALYGLLVSILILNQV